MNTIQHKKEWATDTENNMDASQNYHAEQKKSDKKDWMVPFI